jgi:hypothetical protein
MHTCTYASYAFTNVCLCTVQYFTVAKQIFLAKKGEKLGEEIQIREKGFEKQGKSSGLSRALRILYCEQRSKTTVFLPVLENFRVLEIKFFNLWLQ